MPDAFRNDCNANMHRNPLRNAGRAGVQRRGMMRHRSIAPSAQRLSELDALRGIAAFLVLIQHLRYMGLDPRPFDQPAAATGGATC